MCTKLNRSVHSMIAAIVFLFSAFFMVDDCLSASVPLDGESNSPPQSLEKEGMKLSLASLEKDVFAKVDVLNCDQTKVVITTTCTDKSQAYCFNQNIAFITQSRQKKYRQIHYDQPYRDGDSPFILSAACAKFQRKYYVVLNSLRNSRCIKSCTTYMACRECEWDDVFTSTGQYKWSTWGYEKTPTFKRTLVAEDFFDYFTEHSNWFKQAHGRVRISIIALKN